MTARTARATRTAHDTARQSLTAVLDGLEAARGQSAALTTARNILNASATDIPGAEHSLATWMRTRHGLSLDTLQADTDGSGLWAPMRRTIDATTRAGGVFLEHSLREYAGSRVLSANARGILVETDWQIIAYRLSPSEAARTWAGEL